MSGIFGASLFWVGVNWLFTLFPATVLKAGKLSPNIKPDGSQLTQI
jgi:hypothetical protein